MSFEDPGEIVNRLKDDEKEQDAWVVAEPASPPLPTASKTVAVPRARRRRKQPSFLGPLLLIGAGAYFLLRNLGVALPEPNWDAAFALWPLLLVFGGLKMIVQQAPRPLAGLLSLLASAAFVGVLGYVLFFSAALPWETLIGARPLVVEEVVFETPATEANITLALGSPGAEIAAGAPGSPLIAGQVAYVGSLRFDKETRRDVAEAHLEAWQTGWFSWQALRDAPPWTLTLAPDARLDLQVDAGSGVVDLDLRGLTLESLVLDSGSGMFDVKLPAGRYPVSMDFGSGAGAVLFAAGSDLDVRLDGGSGAIWLQIPDGTAAQITVDAGSGAFEADARFTLVDGDWNDGVWQTAGFDSASTRLVLDLDLGSGATRVTAP